MKQPFTIRRLSWGAFVLEGDNNFPHRAELAGHYDIDGDKHAIAGAVGLKRGGASIAIDAGAFVGDTAAIFSEYCAKVYAFEPFLDAAVCAWLNTKNLGNVEVINRPTGNGEKVELVFECPGPNFGMRSVRVGHGPDAVASMKIDQLGLTRCDFIKIDVEGREIETLLGARETIRRCRPVLFVEMYEDGLRKQGHTPKELEDTLRSFGYDLAMWGEPPRWDWLCRPTQYPDVPVAKAEEWPGTAAEHRLRAIASLGGKPLVPADPATDPEGAAFEKKIGDEHDAHADYLRRAVDSEVEPKAD